jgi:hypothetical protein
MGLPALFMYRSTWADLRLTGKHGIGSGSKALRRSAPAANPPFRTAGSLSRGRMVYNSLLTDQGKQTSVRQENSAYCEVIMSIVRSTVEARPPTGTSEFFRDSAGFHHVKKCTCRVLAGGRSEWCTLILLLPGERWRSPRIKNPVSGKKDARYEKSVGSDPLRQDEPYRGKE